MTVSVYKCVCESSPALTLASNPHHVPQCSNDITKSNYVQLYEPSHANRLQDDKRYDKM